jgi:CHRD domain
MFLRKVLSTATFAAVAFAPALAGVREFKVALLSGMQEVPPNTSGGIGCGQFSIDTCANTMAFRITYSCLNAPETAAHIHGAAAPGANAGVVFPLPPGPVKTGIWNYPEALEAAILDGRMYVNIHSAAFPGGELRGQIVSHVAFIDGAQENPPVPGGGVGFGLVNLNTDTNSGTYYIAYGGLGAPETAAHIHGFAAHGTNAGVIVPLPAGSPKVGVFAYPEAAEANWLDGLTYINIHSAAFPGGEIRGQLTRIVNPLDTQQEVPPNPSTATGCGLYSLNRTTDVLGFDIVYCGLSAAETAAHIHGFAPPGANAGVLFPLPGGPRKLGTWAFGAANEPGVVGGRTYANVHTAAFPGGEIRGQILVPPYPCVGDLNADNVVDLADLAILLGNFGGAGGPCQGDANADGVVDLADLAIILGSFGAVCP